MIVTRLGPGFYNITANGRSYDVDKYPDGAWLLFEVLSDDRGREFINDYPTKRAALAAIKEI